MNLSDGIGHRRLADAVLPCNAGYSDSRFFEYLPSLLGLIITELGYLDGAFLRSSTRAATNLAWIRPQIRLHANLAMLANT